MSTIALLRHTRAETMRLRRWPAVWIIVGAWLALSILFGYLFNYLSYTTGDTSFSNEGATDALLLAEMMPANVPAVFLQGMPMFGGALLMVLGAIVAGNGYGWGTWKTLFSLGGSRTSTVAGSMLALTGIVLAVLVASLAVDLGLATLIAVTESQDVVLPGFGDVAQAFGAGFLILQMWALLGYLLGTLTRSPALAVGLGLVWSLVVENLLRGVGQLLSWVDSLTQVLPGTSAGSLVGSIIGVSPGEGTPGVLDTVAGPQAAVTVAAYVVLAAAVTLLVVRRRDVA